MFMACRTAYEGKDSAYFWKGTSFVKWHFYLMFDPISRHIYQTFHVFKIFDFASISYSPVFLKCDTVFKSLFKEQVSHFKKNGITQNKRSVPLKPTLKTISIWNIIEYLFCINDFKFHIIVKWVKIGKWIK